MAQIYLPEHPCERDQLLGSASTSDSLLAQRLASRFSSVKEHGTFRREVPEAQEEA